MRVLGIDPGYAIVGWGVVEYAGNRFAPIAYGAVCTDKDTPFEQAEARGVILLAAAQCGVPIYEYTPMQVKQAVTGYGKAVKKQIQEMTRIMLHLQTIPKPDDTADALAMAVAHCHCSRSRLMGTAPR